MGLDRSLSQINPRPRIHCNIHLPRPTKNEHPLPSLLQRAGSTDGRTFLTSPIGVSRSVGQIVLQHGIGVDKHLASWSRTPKRSPLGNQTPFHDLGSSRVRHIGSLNRQRPAPLLHQLQRSGAGSCIHVRVCPSVANISVVCGVRRLVDGEGRLRIGPGAKSGDSLTVFDDRPVRPSSVHRKVSDLKIVPHQGEIRVRHIHIEFQIHICPQLPGRPNLHHVEDSVIAVAVSADDQLTRTPVRVDGRSVGARQGKNPAVHPRYTAVGVRPCQRLPPRKRLVQSSGAGDRSTKCAGLSSTTQRQIPTAQGHSSGSIQSTNRIIEIIQIQHHAVGEGCARIHSERITRSRPQNSTTHDRCPRVGVAPGNRHDPRPLLRNVAHVGTPLVQVGGDQQIHILGSVRHRENRPVVDRQRRVGTHLADHRLVGRTEHVDVHHLCWVLPAA